MKERIIKVLVSCLLVQLLLCLNVDAERLEESVDSLSLLEGHKHRRRSAKSDPRYLGFSFEIEPKSTIASADNSAILHCKFRLNSTVSFSSEESEPNADVRVEWRKDSVPINLVRSGAGRIGYRTNKQDFFSTSLSNGSLAVEDAFPADEGVYQCAVSVTPNNFFHQPGSFGSSLTPFTFLSRRAVLTLPSLQRFEYQPINQKVFVGQFAAFRCLLDSKPAAAIEWYKNNGKLEAGEHGITILPLSRTLEISNAQTQHSGSYKCVARNGPKSRNSQIATLEVVEGSSDIGAISLVLEPRSQVVRVGEAFLLECLVNGSPKPKIRWLHDSTSVMESEGRIKLVGSDRSSLLVYSALLEDFGIYTCRAENVDDSIDSSATISMRAPPTISVPPRDIFTQETTDAEFECVAEGLPRPRITWFKNGEVIVPSEYFVVSRLTKFSKIRDGVRDDQGIYQCFADNDDGSAQSHAQLTVGAAEILSPYYALSAQTGVDQEATNSVALLPSTSSNELLGQVSLLINATNDNSTSHMALTAGQNVQDAPQTPLQPLGLTANEIKSQTISLSWDPPLSDGSGAVLMYHVFFRREEDSTRERTVNTTSSSVVVNSLQPNSVYVIRVVAANHAGTGKSSDVLKVSTKQGESVPGKVRNLRAEVLGSETILVDWDQPATSVGPEALRYKLFYVKDKAQEDEKENPSLALTRNWVLYNFLTITNLDGENVLHTAWHGKEHKISKNLRYRIRVEAEGQNGAGPSSDHLDVHTLSDVPSAPPQNVRVEATQQRTIQVVWQPPPHEHANGVITGYKIRYKTKRRGSKGNVAVVDGNPGSYSIVDGVESGSHYTVRIAAMTQNGTGPFSDWFGVDTPVEEREEAQIAGAPSELRVHAAYDSVQVAWLPPRDENVMVRGYLIGWGINLPDVEKATVDAEARQFIIKGLKPNREYVISLRAFNNVGNGFPIYETVKTSAYGPSGHQDFVGAIAPSKTPHSSQLSTPIGLVADAVSSTQIRLSWTDPNEGFNQYYTIRYSSSGDNNGQVRQMNTSETEQIIDGLRPNTQYEFSVKLVESLQWSMSVVNKTLSAPPSSAPRDLTILPQSAKHHDDPNTVMLSWQPPKYANGEIEEYIVLYSDRLDLSDKDWIMDSIKGDRLSMLVRNLLPKSTYYFKIQARNSKGYGPLSPVSTYTPENTAIHFGPIDPMDVRQRNEGSKKGFSSQIAQLLTSNLIYVLIGVISVVLLLLIVILTVVCVQRKSSSSAANKSGTPRRRSQQSQYGQGRKSSKNNQPDLWIQQNTGGRFAALNGAGMVQVADYMEAPVGNIHDMKRFGASVVAEPPRYQTLQETGMTQSQTSYLSDCAYASNRISPSSRHCQQRKSLPPRISSSVTPTLCSSPFAYSAMGHRQRIVTIHTPLPTKAGKGSNEREEGGQRRETSNSSFTTDQQPNGSFQGVGIPVVPQVLSAKRSATANLKGVAVGGKVNVKAVNFSPDIDGYIDDEPNQPPQQLPLLQSQQKVVEVVCHSDGECNGTLARSYHQSSISLEAQRQRTPQVLYTGVNRQPITKVDFAASSDHGSYGSNNALQQLPNTPPPPMEYPSSSSQLHDGYQTVRGLNPLKSFAQMGGPPPVGSASPLLPGSSSGMNGEQRTAHIVRPVVFASPTLRNPVGINRPAGIVIGQKSAIGNKLPVGRATAQPRVNVANAYSPYSTVRVAHEAGLHSDNCVDNGFDEHKHTDKYDPAEELKPLRPAPSTEEINVHEIDHMIDTLQQLQQEFTER